MIHFNRIRTIFKTKLFAFFIVIILSTTVILFLDLSYLDDSIESIRFSKFSNLKNQNTTTTTTEQEQPINGTNSEELPISSQRM